MTIINDFQNGVTEALNFGKLVRFKYYTTSWGAGSYYDDDITLSVSGGNLWVSGVVLPISSTKGSSDAVLLEQGKILTNDTKLYVQGSVDTSGTIKIGLGSPIENEYQVLVEGVSKWEVNNVDILKKLYIRRLETGSLYGE